MIAIIGAGISGLTLAYRLQQQGTPYILLESSAMPGGYMQSETFANRVLEKGPNSILADELVLNFIKEIGLDKQVVKANTISKKRYVYKNGRYRTLPSGPLSLLFSSYFSFRQRLAIFKEYFNRQPYRNDSTLYELICERFGIEAADYALDPFVSGVYAGTPKELLADLCFPVLGKNIITYGSILKGFIKNPPKRRTSLTFQKGMSQLIQTLASKVSNIRYNAEVESMKEHHGSWTLTLTNQEELSCNKVVFALPAYRAANMVRSFSLPWAERLAAIEYPMVRNMHLVFKKEQLGIETKGFGALHPSVEPLFTAGVIWNSATFDQRTPDDEILLTCIVTEKRTPLLKTMNETQAQEMIVKEIKSLYGVKGEPAFAQIGTWEKGIPQYTGKMTTILKHSGELEKMNVYICSNWPYGISISDCIHRAHDLAAKWKS
ncbi:MAG TPA: protoporphyrinogen oxidase [Cytophagaceae bacterium]|jgi:oxygen-dependent protoporphyrinogen oxidase|nr:protoporphyrinogen oxidase [Cytophagaceae bacterium]